MRILVIFTGGTIGSTENNGIVDTDGKTQYKLINLYKEYAENCNDEKADFDTITPYQILSENLTCDKLKELSDCICKVDQSQYDGIIITHGTDTLQYTAAFAGYVFRNTQIPIVFVSANYVLDDERSNGLDNFYYAVKFIQLKNEKGVFVSYRNSGDYPKIHFAARLIEHQSYSDDIYSVNNSFYGYFDNGKFILNSDYTTGWDYNPKMCDDKKEIFQVPQTESSSGVLKINPYPGMRYRSPADYVKAVLHLTYHSGTICSVSPDLKQFAEYTHSKGIPVFVSGAGTGAEYESRKCFEELGFYVLPAASPAAMYIKLWLCIINGKDAKETADIMFKNIAHDVL